MQIDTQMNIVFLLSEQKSGEGRTMAWVFQKVLVQATGEDSRAH